MMQELGYGPTPHLENFNIRTRWDKNVLSWRVLALQHCIALHRFYVQVTKLPSNDLDESRVRQTLQRAFRVWERHADLKFFEADTGVSALDYRLLSQNPRPMLEFIPRIFCLHVTSDCCRLVTLRSGGRLASTGTGTRSTKAAELSPTPSSPGRAAHRVTSTSMMTSSGRWAASGG